jgi:hypothetical protein
MDRPEQPESILTRDGDLDNHIKVLLDALRMPHNDNEARKHDDGNEQVCLCLLEDDSIVTGLNIYTVTSLESLPRNHVKLTIDVEFRTHDLVFNRDDDDEGRE